MKRVFDFATHMSNNYSNQSKKSSPASEVESQLKVCGIRSTRCHSFEGFTLYYNRKREALVFIVGAKSV